MEIKKNAARRMHGSHPENIFQQLRIRSGLTQEQAVEYLGCDVWTIQRYELGKRLPDLERFVKIMELYGCASDEFLRGIRGYIGRVMG